MSHPWGLSVTDFIGRIAPLCRCLQIVFLLTKQEAIMTQKRNHQITEVDPRTIEHTEIDTTKMEKKAAKNNIPTIQGAHDDAGQPLLGVVQPSVPQSVQDQ